MSEFDEPLLVNDTTTVIPVTRRTRRGDHMTVGVITVTTPASTGSGFTGSTTTWTPTVDGNRVALIGVCTGFVAATLGSLAVLRQPPWPRLVRRV